MPMGHEGLLEYGLKLGKKLFAAEENEDQKTAAEQILTFLKPVRHLFFELFLLVSSVNLFEVY
jgi:hypothetical protein